ncbi:hypothetical protein MJ904_10570 [Massilia sp. MB5]|uniref:hypothetical protein n=1 Tax=unclassified Massilia TaxID=2609279 RepID=UPI00067CF1DF|nr:MULTISPECIES: hypothetical protein [unclassified Massilia]AKU22640.1 hypothetical protein ACZ75_15345 [Massilia sp. NR 4-1]UMR32572.1 hypothetical protein MJ904_10570 [Massilia sp. MB5]
MLFSIGKAVIATVIFAGLHLVQRLISGEALNSFPVLNAVYYFAFVAVWFVISDRFLSSFWAWVKARKNK